MKTYLLIYFVFLHTSCAQIEVIPYEEHVLNIMGIFAQDAPLSNVAFRKGIDFAAPENAHIGFSHTVVNLNASDSFSVWKSACEHQDALPYVVFGPQLPYADIAIEDTCRIAGIPYFQATWRPPNPDIDLSTPPDFPTFNLYPDADDIAEAMAKVLDYYSWSSFTILYEDNLGLIRVQKLLAAKEASGGSITVRQLTPGGDNKPIFKELKQMLESKILLDCHVDRIAEYLLDAGKVNMLNEYQSFIIANLDTHTWNLTKIVNLSANVTWLNMINPVEYTMLDPPLGKVVKNWKDIGEGGIDVPHIEPQQAKLEAILAHDLANHLMTSISAAHLSESIDFVNDKPPVLCSRENRGNQWPTGKRLVQFILATNSTGFSGRIKFDALGRRVNYTMYVEEAENGDEPKVVAEWDSFSKKLKDVRPAKSERDIKKRKNKHLYVVSRLAEPYLQYKKTKSGEKFEGNDKFEGYSLNLMEEIVNVLREEGLNYTFSFLDVPKDISYGKLNNETGQWDGLIGMLLTKDADLAVCDLTITEERRRVVDFSVPFMTLGISILFTKETKEEPETFSFLNPFSLEVWLYTATSYLVVSIALFIAARISPADWENPQPCEKEPEELENIWNFKNCTWLTIGSVMTQGCDILPKAPGSRWIVGIWWFFTLIVVQTYIAQLAASLTNTRTITPINDVEDLANQNEIQYGLLEHGSTRKFFQESKVRPYNKMWETMEAARPPVLTKTSDEGVTRVLKGKHKYAFFMETVTIEYKMKRNCELTQIGGFLDTKHFGIAMPANSPFRNDIDHAILTLQQNQKLKEIKQTWWSEKFNPAECPNEEKDESEDDLEVQNLIGAFLVLGVGCALAVVISCAEFYNHCRNVVISEEVPIRQVFFEELKASLNLSNDQKPVLKKGSSLSDKESSGSPRERSRSRSRAPTLLREIAANFFQAEKINR